MIEKKLKPAELAERSNTLAALVEQINEIKSDAAEAASDFKKEIRTREIECTKLARIIRTGVEIIDNQMQLTGKED